MKRLWIALFVSSFILTACATNQVHEKSVEEINLVSQKYHNQGILYCRAGNYKKCLELFSHAEELTPNDKHLVFDIAHAYKNTGNFDKAIQYYKKLISLDPYEHRSYGNLGYIYYELEKYDDAAETFKKLLTLTLDDEGALYYLTVIYFNKKDFISAKEYIMKFKNATSKNSNLHNDADKKRIKNALEKFGAYMQVIDRELSNK